jgi:uncharacterized protein (TIGR03086 family)
MSQNLRNYTKAIYTLDAVVQRVPADCWDKQSPCDEWNARQVLGHFMWGLQRVTAVASGQAIPEARPEADVAGPDPRANWSATRDAALAALDHPGAIAQPFTGPFGPGTLDGFFGIHIVDCVLHTWDIAHTAGIDAHLPLDLVEGGAAGLAAAGDAVRAPGVFGPAVTVAADADAVTRFVALAGRNPA